MNWKITQIKTLNNPELKTIVNVSFSVSDGTSTIESDANLLPADTESFINLKDITEEQVIEFLKNVLNDNNIEGMISGVERMENLVTIKSNTHQPKVTPLPWA